MTRPSLRSLALTLALVAPSSTLAQSPPPAAQTSPGAATAPTVKTPAPSTTTPAPSTTTPPPRTTTPATPEALPAALYAKGAGLSLRELSDGEKKKLGRTGYMVDAVTADSPAAKAGITKGDIVTSIDGASMESARALVDKLNGAEEGHLFKVSVVRGGKDLVIDVQMPGETKEEREKREEEEQKKREEEEAKEREENEAKEKLEKEREEAEQRAKEEAEKATDEGKELGENVEQAVEDDDKFGLLGCCICSALCPPASPILFVTMLLVDGAPAPRERAPLVDDEATITVVRY